MPPKMMPMPLPPPSSSPSSSTRPSRSARRSLSRSGLVILSLLASASAGEGRTKAEDDRTHSSPLVLTTSDLTSMAAYLRGDDDRLFRYSAADLTAERQNDPKGGCGPTNLPAVLAVLKDDEGRTLEDRIAAADVAALCTTDNPENRARIGLTDGIHAAIVDLLNEVGLYWAADLPDEDEKDKDEDDEDEKEEGEEGGKKKGEGKDEGDEDDEKNKKEKEEEEEEVDPNHVDTTTNPPPPVQSSAAAAAAELAYALSFNSGTNHDGLLSAGAVEALARIVTRCNPRSYFEGYRLCTPHVRMWTMAALQNLAASYCGDSNNDDADGRCSWIWTDDDALVVDEDVSGEVTVDGSKARERMMKFGGLAEALVHEACLGSVRLPDGRPNREVPWPGEDATKGRDEMKLSIVPWSAAGALKNLALNDEGREEAKAASLCLCAMSASPDWLEIDKGEAALYHMGVDDLCHFWTEEIEPEEGKGEEEEEGEGDLLAGGYCVDYDWIYEDEEGDVVTCRDIQDEEACEEMEDYVDGEDVDVNEACCVCGGGDRVEEKTQVEEKGQGDEL